MKIFTFPEKIALVGGRRQTLHGLKMGVGAPDKNLALICP